MTRNLEGLKEWARGFKAAIGERGVQVTRDHLNKVFEAIESAQEVKDVITPNPWNPNVYPPLTSPFYNSNGVTVNPVGNFMVDKHAPSVTVMPLDFYHNANTVAPTLLQESSGEDD